MRQPLLAAAPVLAAIMLAGCAGQPDKPVAPPVTVLADAALARTPLATIRPVADDHGIALGGIGSDLYPGDRPDEYWSITDRGPNGQVKVDGKQRRTFPVPDFDPALLRLRVDGGTLRVEQAIPITTTDGRPVTGLSNTPGHDEAPYDLTARTPLPYNPNGLDPEGMVRTPGGEFWLSEEYSPSLLRLSATGTVLARYVPAGLSLPGAGYPVYPTLPAELSRRQQNRGFEALALAPDGDTLYAALQSPLDPPPDEGREVRLLAFDTRTGQPGAEYRYPLEDVNTFDPSAKGKQNDMKISALAWYGPDRLVVDERTDKVAKLYLFNLADQRKTPLVDLTATVPGLPEKIEGIAVRDPRTIAVACDNDFGMTDGPDAFGPDGRSRDSGKPSRLLVLRLP
ncbi:esterase-like activity of phytase family protein [Pseudonocardia eucalypti]|uniref:Esterase-like activity of phytase family protein n=1 Tax=Pseudonocardia eucalypti TaxID=648755 RepID=A0ABP9PUY0_9PSEU|nr:hypothetical protein [Pseudonocardia eucalypti]